MPISPKELESYVQVMRTYQVHAVKLEGVEIVLQPQSGPGAQVDIGEQVHRAVDEMPEDEYNLWMRRAQGLPDSPVEGEDH